MIDWLRNDWLRKNGLRKNGIRNNWLKKKQLTDNMDIITAWLIFELLIHLNLKLVLTKYRQIFNPNYMYSYYWRNNRLKDYQL